MKTFLLALNLLCVLIVMVTALRENSKSFTIGAALWGLGAILVAALL